MSIHLPATTFVWPWFFCGVLDRRGEAGEVAEFEKIAEWESAGTREAASWVYQRSLSNKALSPDVGVFKNRGLLASSNNSQM
ncbi:unnamed protein product [Sphagnum troendelagicum]|uniref:Uncharacterized protein n=1 Tax=Sphagnum troendelagicum TaxID=128251 RepID=A0ABP0TCT8_9BRYO